MTYLVIFAILATVTNSIGDAMKFSGAVEQTFWIDFAWHCIKYFIQIPLWMLEGYFLIKYWLENNLWDFWHPKKSHIIIGVTFLSCAGLWQITYYLTILILR